MDISNLRKRQNQLKASIYIISVFWTITIGSILFSLYKIKSQFQQSNFNGTLMVSHILLFSMSYAVVLWHSIMVIVILEEVQLEKAVQLFQDTFLI